jgi:hypothetical protein
MSTSSVIPAGVTPFRDGSPAASQPAPEAATPAFTGTYTLLADISEFQPDIADAAYLEWSKGISIRAMYGGAEDDGAWYGGARRADLHSGGAQFLNIYQYLVSGQSGQEQAEALMKLLGGLEKGEVITADFEEGQHAMLTAWYNEMITLGVRDQYLWTYTGLNFGSAAGALPVQWLADYSTAEPASPHILWQFTDDYDVPGVGTADCSVYHGTITELAELAYGGTVTTTPPAEGKPVTGTQSGWHWCAKCQGLVHGAGKCAAGGTHELGTWNYSVPFEHS